LLCRNCTRERPHFDLARSVALYDGVIRKAIHNFKFNGKTALAEHLAKIMTNHIQHHLPEIKYCHADVIVTVPLSARRLKERGYNQVDLIAEVLAKDLNLPHEKMALKRAKETNAQFNLSRQERRSNIAGAFEVDDIASILGKRILLLDDIYTTGLTINECAKALKQKGAAKIYALTLSRAVLD
jgi:ComF family protein